jgi:hypothetical protein
MTITVHINAAVEGCSDLDDVDVAKKLCDLIKDRANSLAIELDLRECFLDYGPCSIVIEFLLLRLASLEGSKSLIVEMLVDLGSAEPMALLLARAAETITGPHGSQLEVRTAVAEYCIHHQINFLVRVYCLNNIGGPAQPSSYRDVCTYNLGSLESQEER